MGGRRPLPASSSSRKRHAAAQCPTRTDVCVSSNARRGAARARGVRGGAARGAVARAYAGENRARIALRAAARITGVVVDDAGAPMRRCGDRRPGRDGGRAFVGRDRGAARAASGQRRRGTLHARRAPGRPHALRARAEHHEPAVVPALEAPSAEPRGSCSNARRRCMARCSTRGQARCGRNGHDRGQRRVAAARVARRTRAALSSSSRCRAASTSCAPAAADSGEPPEGVVVEPASDDAGESAARAGRHAARPRHRRRRGAALAELACACSRTRSAARRCAPRPTPTACSRVGACATLRIACGSRAGLRGRRRAGHSDAAEAGLALPSRCAARPCSAGSVVDEPSAPLAGVELEVAGTTATGEPVRVVHAGAAGPRARPAATRRRPRATTWASSRETCRRSRSSRAAAGPPTCCPSSCPASGTDAEGRFRIEGVPPGRIEIVARRTGFAHAAAPDAGRAGPATRATLRRWCSRAGPSCSAALVDPGGFAVAERARPARDGGRAGGARDPERRRRPLPLRGAARPLHGDRAPAARAPRCSEQVELAPGERRELLLALAGEGARSTGRVLDPRGFPIGVGQRSACSALDTRAPRSAAARCPRTDGTFQSTALPHRPTPSRSTHPDYADTRLARVSPAARRGSCGRRCSRAHACHGLVDRPDANEGIAARTGPAARRGKAPPGARRPTPPASSNFAT